MPRSVSSSRSTRSASSRRSRKPSLSSSGSDSSWAGSSDSGATARTGYTTLFNSHPSSGFFGAPKPKHDSPPRPRAERKQHRSGKHSAADKAALRRREQGCIDAIATAEETFKKAVADANMAWYTGKIDIKTAQNLEKEAKKARDRQVEALQAVWRGYRKDARKDRKLKRIPVDPVQAILSERLAEAREAYEEAKSAVDAQVRDKKLDISVRWSKGLLSLDAADKETKSVVKKMEPEYKRVEDRYEEHKKYIKDTHFYPEAIRKKLNGEWKRYMKELKHLDKKAERKKMEMMVRWHKGLFSLETEMKKEERIRKRFDKECHEEKRWHEKVVEDIKEGTFVI